MIAQIEYGRIHSEDCQCNRRCVEEKLVEGQVDQRRRADNHIRRITNHRRDPAHIRSQNLRYYKRYRIDAKTVEHFHSKRDKEKSYSDAVEEGSHTGGQ